MAKNNPRILFVGTLPPPVHGSAVVSQQIRDSKVINETFDCDWINLGTSRAMDEIGKKTLAKPFRLLGALCREFWLLLTHKYDLCYLAITCHGVGFLKDSPFILMAKLFRKKIVIHQHNKGMANDVDRWPYKWLLPLCYKNAKVILLSWYLYPDIEKVVKKEDVYICPNGIKVQEFKGSRVQHSPESNRVPRLLFLSNLIESKGVLVLLDALKILKDKGYSFICVFVGGETKEIECEVIKNVGQRSRVMIIRMRHVPFVDSTGLNNLRDTVQSLQGRGIQVLLSGVRPEVAIELHRSGMEALVGAQNIHPSFDLALAHAEELVGEE